VAAETRRRMRRPSGSYPRHTSAPPAGAVAVSARVAAGARMLEINAVLTFAAPFRHESIVTPSGDYSGGPLQGISRHAGARRDIELQLEFAESLLTACSFACQASMVRRRSTIRFRKGAPFHGAFSILEPRIFGPAWGHYGGQRGDCRAASMIGEDLQWPQASDRAAGDM